MRKAKGLLAFVGTSAFLFSCSKSLSRTEAVDLLDKIVLEVKSKTFEKPTSYNVTYRKYDNKSFTEISVNASFANTSKNHYSHCKTTTKVYEEDPKINSKAAYSLETKDEYYYIDPLASSSTFISYSEIIEENYSTEGLASTEKEAVIAFSETEGETALEEWENKMKDSSVVGDSFLQDITSKPSDLDKYLKRLSSDQDTLIKETEIKSQGDGDLDVYIVTVIGENEESRSFKFDGYLIRRYEIITSESTVSASYSWNSYKSVYPDLNKASSEVSETSLN